VIRELRDEDIPAAARIRRELRPDAMHSENGLRQLVGSFPERANLTQEGSYAVVSADGPVSSPSSGGRRQTASSESSPTTTSATRRCSRSTASWATSRSPSGAGT
jgi:hypothetical protein